ncbi:SAM-dependent methyltransferase [Actinospica acidithermotolerans]|nr:SAM-dependent methyltransferase [Actinospica acidithermotolerans]
MMDPVDRAELALSLGEIDPDTPSPARIYDFWLGGSNNFAADREVGRRSAEAMPQLPIAARANRAFLGRVVHHLVADLGVDQLLDLGSGVPTAGNVHEVARAANPEARVVYVDIDPVAIAHARALLADVDGCEAILADLRNPAAVLDHPLLRSTIDLARPVAVMMFAVLHFIPDDASPELIVRDFMEAVPDGSYLAISHGTPDRHDPGAQQDAARSYAARVATPFIARTPEEVAALLGPLKPLPPGLVPIDEWMPDPPADPKRSQPAYGGIARKI